MDISSYLSELVQTQKLIGIPGLGTIYKKKSPGRYDVATHSFVPPSYTLDFTEEVKEETALAEFISKNRGLSMAATIYFIQEFSSQVHRQLDDQKEVDLESIGKLSRVDGQVIFKPATELNYGFDFYGLPSIKAEPPVIPAEKTQEPVIRAEETSGAAADQDQATEEPAPPEETVVQEQPAVEEPIVEQPDVEEPAEEEPAAEEPTPESVAADNEVSEENPGTGGKSAQQLHDEIEALNYYRAKTPSDLPLSDQEDTILNLKEPELVISPVIDHGEFISVFPDEEKKTTPVFLKVLLVILILLIILTATYILKPDLVNGWLGNSPAAPQTTVMPKDTLQETAPVRDSALVNDTAKNIPAAADTVKARPAATDTATTYEIIGASVLNQKEADYFILLMKRSGVRAKVVTNMPGRRLKMSIATLKDKKSADLERERLEKKLKIDGIYIYRNKPQ
jgi:hypothetical protein